MEAWVLRRWETQSHNSLMQPGQIILLTGGLGGFGMGNSGFGESGAAYNYFPDC